MWPAGWTVEHVAVTGSTNRDLLEAAAQLPDRSVRVTDHQTAGKGRLDRRWDAPPGTNLLVSILFHVVPARPIDLTRRVALAAIASCREVAGADVVLKWPNDLLRDDRKLAGILAEASSGTEGVAYVVLGIGINLRNTAYPPELGDRATSIERELGRAADGGRILGELLAALEERLVRIREGSSTELLEAWRRLSPSSAGGAVEFDAPEGRATGVAAGIDETGALLVRAGGRVERVIAGEVVWK